MKALVSGYYGFGNFGDELILSCLCSHLKWLGVEVSVLSSNPKITSATNGVNAYYSFDFKSLFSTISKHDVLISGGGSLLQDVTSKKSLIYYLLIIFVALLLRKKVLIFAQGIGPINNSFLKLLTKLILKNCTYVSVRDEKSHDLLSLWKIDSDLLCDPVFSLCLPEHSPSNIVGIQLREFHTLDKNNLKFLAQKIISNYSDKKIQIFSFQDKFDFEISKYFQNLLLELNPNIEVEVLHALTYLEIIQKMSNLEIIFAMRYHALILALMYGIKSVAINYDIKVEKLSNEVNIPLVNIDFSNIEEVEPKNIKITKTFDWARFDEFLK